MKYDKDFAQGGDALIKGISKVFTDKGYIVKDVTDVYSFFKREEDAKEGESDWVAFEHNKVPLIKEKDLDSVVYCEPIDETLRLKIYGQTEDVPPLFQLGIDFSELMSKMETGTYYAEVLLKEDKNNEKYLNIEDWKDPGMGCGVKLSFWKNYDYKDRKYYWDIQFLCTADYGS